jgi:hypothetical protein
MRLVFLFATLFLVAAPAKAQPAVDTALVLAVDSSGSIDAEEFKLQKEGIALAITDQGILNAIRSGGRGRIAIAYVEWGTPGAPSTVVDWMIVSDKASAQAFAGRVLAAPRSAQSFNAIGDAIVLGTALIKTCPCKPVRAVIDISGDNRDLRSHVPAPVAREAAAQAGITVNALAILESATLGASGRPALVEAYENEVIGGFGAFVVAARERRDFARALRQKMALEISGLTPDEQPTETARHP